MRRRWRGTLPLVGITAASLLQQVSALPADERDEFLAELIARFPVQDDAVEIDSPEWITEVERRARRVLAGESTADDWDTAEQRILARLADE